MSPRDVQEIDHFGRQLNKSEFIRDCYQKATSSSYGHCLIDFDQKTSESSRFFSKNNGTAPTSYYPPGAKATALTNGREKRSYTEALAKQKSLQKKFMSL